MKIVVKTEGEGKKTFSSLARAQGVTPATDQSLLAIDAFKGQQDMAGFDGHGNKMEAKVIYEKGTVSQ